MAELWVLYVVYVIERGAGCARYVFYRRMHFSELYIGHAKKMISLEKTFGTNLAFKTFIELACWNCLNKRLHFPLKR